MMQTFDVEHNRLFNELTATLKEDIVKIRGEGSHIQTKEMSKEKPTLILDFHLPEL